ncbi:MAG: EamA family transporter [Cyanobacteriota bacterium]|nr:EamA family transporter [Cyanobacteriota bacterium]
MTGLLTPATPTPAVSVGAALAAALCWTLATLLWRGLPAALTANQLNLCKTLLAFLLQLPLLALVRWPAGQGGALLTLALSGVVGIAWGDSLFFSALRRLGSRRCLTLTAGGPALSALVGLVTLGEQPRPPQWLGIGLISLSVGLVARQAPPDASRGPTASSGIPWAGLALALAAMACGTAGALLARGALRSGEVPALLAASVRLGGGTLALTPVLFAMARGPGLGRSTTGRWSTVVAATLLGTSAGILLQQMALTGLPGGLAVALLSTSPVMALPFARLEGDRPGRLGLLAALAATAGVSLVAGIPLPARVLPGRG